MFVMQIVGNLDVTPTMMHLAAGEDAIPSRVDGKSVLPYLLPSLTEQDGEERPQGRTHFLVEYLSVGTYFNDHSGCWQPGNDVTKQCGGNMPRGPPSVCSLCDEWRSLKPLLYSVLVYIVDCCASAVRLKLRTQTRRNAWSRRTVQAVATATLLTVPCQTTGACCAPWMQRLVRIPLSSSMTRRGSSTSPTRPALDYSTTSTTTTLRTPINFKTSTPSSTPRPRHGCILLSASTGTAAVMTQRPPTALEN